jgi:hypothetical protein
MNRGGADGLMNTDGHRCVANMLLRGSQRDELLAAASSSSSAQGLGAVLQRVDHFLAAARSAPPAVNLELAGDGDSDGGDTQLVLNVVAGILEEKPALDLQRKNHVVLPTEHNEQILLRDKMDESIAMLHLMAALSGRAMPSSKITLQRSQQADDDEIPCEEGGDADYGDGSSSSSGCAIMDATSGSDDEDQHPPPKRPVTEM